MHRRDRLARFAEGKIIETFSTLVDPERELPAAITHLTGIRPDDLVGAPRLRQVLRRVADSWQSARPRHNVQFDLVFLRRQGILLTTCRWTHTSLPRSSADRARYNLTSPDQQLAIVLEDAHRALADATATAHLYWALWQRVLDIPLTTLQEIVDASHALPEWEAGPVFQAAYAERIKTAFDEPPRVSKGRDPIAPAGAFDPIEGAWEPLRPNAATALLNADVAAAVLGEDGPLAKYAPGYEHRPQQIEMLRAVTEAFNRGKHLMVEAGTGTGKSLAYLIPAILWAKQNNERVVISTNTINLQDQLIAKDIPLLREVMGVDFQAAVVKGRGNYLCPRRLATMRRRLPTTVDEMRVFAKVLIWLLEFATATAARSACAARRRSAPGCA
jgi:DNA polymerase-3 subunit epsilon/ATP-dependent DNA helicase DinG